MASRAKRPPDAWKQPFEEARQALARGWSLIALNGKAPIQKRWQASKNAPLDKILEWTTKGRNLGLRTGQTSGVVVIDDDSPDGSASASLNLPATVTVITGSGKRHFYFRAPDFKVGNSVKTVAKGIDIRGDGGQVVFVGSIHPDTQQPYVWAPGCSPTEIELATLPDHLIAKLRPVAKRPKAKLKLVTEDVAILSDGKRSRIDNYIKGALDAELDRVMASSEGNRNDTLNKAAFALGQLIGTGELDREKAREALRRAGAAIGLSETEVDATINSGFAAGEKEPRDLSSVGENKSTTNAEDSAQEDGDVAGDDDNDEDDDRPVIKIAGGFLHTITDRAERVLLRQHPPLFYQRGTILVRVAALPQAAVDRTITHKPTIQEVTTAAMIDHLTRLIRWKRLDKKTDEYFLVDCPERVALTLSSRSGGWRLPSLIGVIDSPTLRPDGEPLATEGYDRKSGLYLSLCGAKFPPIPSHPTRDDALAALGQMLTVLEHFPFVTDADRSVAIAAILTALIRPSLRTAPLFAFLAAKMGSGKSLLADTVSLIATGRPAAVMSQGADENEDKKRMLPILSEGDPVAVIDNIDRPFGSAALCSILTQPTWRDRVLGKSQTLTLPTTGTTWLATGNNVVFVGDITTRTLVCELDPKCERPEERRFSRNLHHYIPAHRADLVVAGLTVLRAYHVAGRPNMDLTVFGRFEEWSDWVRSALVWLGHADPCITRSRVEANDPVRAELTTLLTALEQHFGTNAFRVSDVLAEVDDNLRAAVAPILATASAGQSPQQRLGIFFQSVERRPEGGIRLVRGPTSAGVALWRIERV